VGEQLRKNRSGLAKIGVLAIALMVSLGAMGLAYGRWTDTININNTVNIGDIDPVLNCGTGSSQITCGVSVINPMMLEFEVNASAAGSYTRNFSLQNTGTVPERIKSIVKDLSGVPAGVTVFVTNGVGTTIDPGQTYTGVVGVSIGHGATLPVNFKFTVTFECVLWYMP
jgi:hypothetical protein